jgi:hypothetical protein
MHGLRGAALLQRVDEVLALSGLARSAYLRRLVAAEQQAAAAFGADMLFTDVDPGAFLLAAVTRLPLASTYQNVLTHGIGTRAWRLVGAAFAPVLAEHGLAARTADALYFDPGVLKLIPSIPELDSADPARPDVCYVGHLLGDLRPEAAAGFAPEPGRRYALVYVGTGALAQPALRRVLPQVFPADGPHRCLVGAQSVTQAETIGGVTFLPYVPVEAALPHTVWVICHGGQNTLIQALRQGVPAIVFPGPIFERRFNAQAVHAAGAGVMGELPDFTPDWLRRALGKQAGYAERARCLGERIRSYGGAKAAVEALERWQAKPARQ